MKITKIEPVLVSLPFQHDAPKPVAGRLAFRDTAQTLYVRVETDAGIVGWGEAFGAQSAPMTISAIASVLGPAAEGLDAADVSGVTDELARRFQNMMRGGPARFALSGIEIALWDIKGKIEHQPLWRLLGGTGKSRVSSYASLSTLEGADTVQRVVTKAAKQGYRQIKLHEKTVEGVAAARAALGAGFPLMVDANCAWTPAKAIDMARAMQPYALLWLEEPVFPPDDYEAMAQVRREGGIPIATGENLGNPNDVKWLTAAGGADIVQPSVIKHGGVSDVLRMIALASRSGIRAVPHSPFIGPGLLATIHILATLADDVPCEHRYCELGANPLGQAILSSHGWLDVPDGPGLGVDPDQDLLARYRIA